MCLSTDFHKFCCTFCEQFGARYHQESVLPTFRRTIDYTEKVFSEVKNSTLDKLLFETFG